VACLDANLMLKSSLRNAGLWICPNTGHAINLEEPAAFNAQVEGFLGAVERGSWRRAYPTAGISPKLDLSRSVHLVGSGDRLDDADADAGLHRSRYQ
jgi:hypothetical protein